MIDQIFITSTLPCSCSSVLSREISELAHPFTIFQNVIRELIQFSTGSSRQLIKHTYTECRQYLFINNPKKTLIFLPLKFLHEHFFSLKSHPFDFNGSYHKTGLPTNHHL